MGPANQQGRDTPASGVITRGRLYRVEPPNLPLSPPACAELANFTKLYPRDTAEKPPPPSLPLTGKNA